MRRLATVMLLVALAVAALSCRPLAWPTRSGRTTGGQRPVAVVIIQSTEVPVTKGRAPSLVSVVGLDGKVATLTVPTTYAGSTGALLSPNGRRLLYNSEAEYPALRVIDLVSKADRKVMMFPPAIPPASGAERAYPTLLMSGWATNGDLVAMTATRHSRQSHGPPPGPNRDYLSDLAVWRGTVGRMGSETATADAARLLTGSLLQRLLVSDDASAWFMGLFGERGQFPNEQRLLRYDFGSHSLNTVATLPNAMQIGGVGSKSNFFLLPPFSNSPNGQSLLTYGVPVVRTETHTRNTPAREYFRTLQGVDLRRLADFQALGSIPVTSNASSGNYVHQNEWGLPLPVLPKDTAGLPVGLPLTGDWGLPVFDPAYGHYMRSRAITGGAEVSAWDVESGEVTVLVGEPDPLAMPLGFTDSSGTALFTASDRTATFAAQALGLFLLEPGKGTRLLTRLPLVPATRFPVYHPTLLGVQYAK